MVLVLELELVASAELPLLSAWFAFDSVGSLSAYRASLTELGCSRHQRPVYNHPSALHSPAWDRSNVRFRRSGVLARPRLLEQSGLFSQELLPVEVLDLR